MVMIAQLQPTPAYLVLAPDGTFLGRVELPLEPDLLAQGTVYLQREMPKVEVTAELRVLSAA